MWWTFPAQVTEPEQLHTWWREEKNKQKKGVATVIKECQRVYNQNRPKEQLHNALPADKTKQLRGLTFRKHIF